MEPVVLYGRRQCPLCDEVRIVLMAEEIPFEEVDITSDPGLEHEYGNYVPVVELGGRIIFHAGMDAAQLPALIAGQQG